MKKLSLFLLLSYSVLTCVFAQSPGNVPTLDVPGELNNQLTSKHVNVTGTKIFIVPPDGYKEKDSGVAGFIKEDTANIEIYTLPGGSFSKVSASFNAEGFAKEGITMTGYKELTIDGMPARLAFLGKEESFKAYSLIMGDKSYGIMIMAVYNHENGDEILGSLLSIVYKEDHEVDPRKNAAFTFDESGSKFKYARLMNNLQVYSIEGIYKESYDDEPFIMATAFPTYEAGSLDDLANAAINKYKESGYKFTKKGKVSREPINGYDAYEFEVQIEGRGQQITLYIFLAHKGTQALLVQGLAPGKYKGITDEFKKLTHTVQFR